MLYQCYQARITSFSSVLHVHQNATRHQKATKLNFMRESDLIKNKVLVENVISTLKRKLEGRHTDSNTVTLWMRHGHAS